jgi:hypothetical protein
MVFSNQSNHVITIGDLTKRNAKRKYEKISLEVLRSEICVAIFHNSAIWLLCADSLFCKPRVLRTIASSLCVKLKAHYSIKSLEWTPIEC